MKVALVYDRVNKFGGAERVIGSLHKIFPEAPLFTLVHEPKSAPWADKFTVIPSFVNSLPFFKKHHEWLPPLSSMAFETLSLEGYDVIISITSSDAKAVLTKPNQVHICYCLTPNRYFWSGQGEYQNDIKFKLIPRWLSDYFRTADLLISTRPDHYLAISNEVKNRISKYYHQDSTVIYPSIDDKFYSTNLVPLSTRKYYLIVGRLVPYKKVDLAIKTFNKLKLPLFVVGSGSEEKKLRQMAGSNIKFVGSVDDDRLIDLYRHAKALIFPQEEDYGLVPLEAQACGTPIIAYAKGGALETVVSDQTGLFFRHQTTLSLANAVKKFEKMKFSPESCFKNASLFREEIFLNTFLSQVNQLWLDHLTNSSG